MSSLQRELQQERERHERSQESVLQLRLELQMMGRLLASAREQLVACGAKAQEPGLVLRTPPPPLEPGQRAGRSKTDARLMQRMQEELAESKGVCQRFVQQLEMQKMQTQMMAATRVELLALNAEMHAYMETNRL